MKKFFAFAFMALTMVFMASCGMGSSNHYKAGDDAPKIDSEKATVNGRHYDNKTEKCWKVTSSGTVSALGITVEAKDKVVYVWETEFELVAEMETAMWTAAQTDGAAKASYKYVVVSAKDSEACLNKNGN